jgi:hypothetical protein
MTLPLLIYLAIVVASVVCVLQAVRELGGWDRLRPSDDWGDSDDWDDQEDLP